MRRKARCSRACASCGSGWRRPAFHPHRKARVELREDLARTRDLLRLEGDLLAGEEAEEILRLGLERLTRRRVLARSAGRIQEGRHPHARDLLAYYARSLAVLERPGTRALAAGLRNAP